jgi:maltose O-acetyltransferase
MLAGDPYVADDPELREGHRRAMRLVEVYNRTSVDEPDERRRILAELLGSIGEGVEIRPPFHCDYGRHIHVGVRTFVNFNLVALDVARITIGEDVQIGPNVQLLTPTHPTDPEPRRAKIEGAKPITIGDNVWLGGGVIVCPGVTIGENTVVGSSARSERPVYRPCIGVYHETGAVRASSHFANSGLFGGARLAGTLRRTSPSARGARAAE